MLILVWNAILEKIVTICHSRLIDYLQVKNILRLILSQVFSQICIKLGNPEKIMKK